MGDFKKWKNSSNGGNDFEMGGWYPFMDYRVDNFKEQFFDISWSSLFWTAKKLCYQTNVFVESYVFFMKKMYLSII